MRAETAPKKGPCRCRRTILAVNNSAALLRYQPGRHIMPNRVERIRQNERQQEIAAIGPLDSKRLHGTMNKSTNSKEIRANKNPDVSAGTRSKAAASANTSTSGSKRHASAGAGPSERTATTAMREGKRATVTRAASGSKTETKPTTAKGTTSRTRRNDIDTQVMPKPMKGSRTKSKSST